MNQLIPIEMQKEDKSMNKLQIICQNGNFYADSREVAEMVGKEHNMLLRDIRTYCEYLGQSNFAQSDFFVKSTYTNLQNKQMPCFLITRKGCDMVANKMTGQKGVLFTATYVTEFDRMEKQLAQPQLPSTYLEALKALVKSEENKQILSAKIEQDKPKVLFADCVASSKQSILIREMAKLLKQNGVNTGGKRLFSWLRANGYLIAEHGSDYNLPTQKSMDLGLMIIRERTYSDDVHIRVLRTPMITGKGQQYFIKKFLKEKSA